MVRFGSLIINTPKNKNHLRCLLFGVVGSIRGKGLINKITIFEGTSPIVGKTQTITTLGTTNLLIPRFFVAPWHTGRPCFPPAKQRHLLGMDLKPFQVIKYQPAKTRLHRQCSMVLPWTLTKTGQSSAKCFIDPWKFWILKPYPTQTGNCPQLVICTVLL